MNVVTTAIAHHRYIVTTAIAHHRYIATTGTVHHRYVVTTDTVHHIYMGMHTSFSLAYFNKFPSSTYGVKSFPPSLTLSSTVWIAKHLAFTGSISEQIGYSFYRVSQGHSLITTI